jgi:hypothetical protein
MRWLLGVGVGATLGVLVAAACGDGVTAGPQTRPDARPDARPASMASVAVAHMIASRATTSRGADE